MPLIAWSDKFATGYKTIDAQHQEFFRRLNALHDALVEPAEKEVVPKTLAFLASYTRIHFHEEEKQMRAAGYPGLEAHRALHNDFAERVQRFIELHAEGLIILTTELTLFVSDWITHHIIEQDTQFTEWLKNQDRAPEPAP